MHSFFRKQAFAIAKNSPYYEILMYELRFLKATGILDHVTERYQPVPQSCPDLSGNALGKDGFKE